MAEIKIDLDSAIQRTQEEAKAALERNLNRASSGIIYKLLENGTRYPAREGLAHEILRKRIEEYVLSDAFTKKVDEAIEANAEEQIARAVKVLLHAKTRKHLFETTV